MPAALVAAMEWVGTYFAMEMTFTAVALMNIATAMVLVGGLAYSAMKARQAKSQARDAYNAAQVDRMVNITSATAPRDLVLGRVRKGGTIAYKASTGAYQKDLYLVIALVGHEIDAIEGYYLNDELVTVDGSGNVTSAPYATTQTLSGTLSTGVGYTATLPANYVVGSVSVTAFGPINDPHHWVADGDRAIGWSQAGLVVTASETAATVHYQYTATGSNVKITQHLGAAGQTVDADLMAAFPTDWVSTNIGQGVAYVVAKLTYSETAFPSGAPNLTVVLRGAKLYDPRTGTTVWSENPALMMRHVYAHPKFGKATVTAAEDVRFIAAANACDTSAVYTVGGIAQTAQALYKGSLVLPYGAAAKDAFDDLAQAMGGSWAFAGGELYCKAGVYTAPVMTLDDTDLAVVQRNGAAESQKPIAIAVHKERAQKYNTVKVKIWDQAQAFKQSELTPLVGSALLTRDGVELVQEVSYPAIGYAPQALHVAGIMMRDARDPLTVELPFKLRAYPLELFDTVSLTLPRYGWTAKTFMILGRVWNADGTLALTLKETGAAITQMDAGFSAQGFAANTNLPKPWQIGAVGALTITSGTNELIKQVDGTVQSRMRVTWAQVTDISVQQAGQVEVQYRSAGSSGAWTSLVVPGDETTVATTEVQDYQSYIVRARCKTKLAVSDWTAQVLHQVIGKTEPPPAFDTFTVMVQPDGTRQYNFSYTSTAPADWLGAEIRYVSGTVATPDWVTMTLLQDATTYYTNSPVELNAPLSGAWTFACKSLDTSGNESPYLVRSITLPGRRLGNIFDEFFEGPDGWLGTKTGCHVQGTELEANDSTTWATLPATWAGWTRWNTTPTSPIYYETPVRDFGTVLAGQINSTVDADGTLVQELATSTNGTTWSAWSSASAPFSTRYLKLRITVTANGSFPVPVIRAFGYQISAEMKSEYLNDIVLSALTGSYRIGVGDVRIPLAGVYSVLKRTTIVVQDSSAGTWTYARIDQSLSPAPRWQFRLNGTLADPAFVDFFIEGY
jgi:hypothetical protein